MNKLKESINALAEQKDLEEWAFYESGLVAHGCLENIDEYMREAITRYGRLLSSKQNEQWILMAEKERTAKAWEECDDNLVSYADAIEKYET